MIIFPESQDLDMALSSEIKSNILDSVMALQNGEETDNNKFFGSVNRITSHPSLLIDPEVYDALRNVSVIVDPNFYPLFLGVISIQESIADITFIKGLNHLRVAEEFVEEFSKNDRTIEEIIAEL